MATSFCTPDSLRYLTHMADQRNSNPWRKKKEEEPNNKSRPASPARARTPRAASPRICELAQPKYRPGVIRSGTSPLRRSPSRSRPQTASGKPRTPQSTSAKPTRMPRSVRASKVEGSANNAGADKLYSIGPTPTASPRQHSPNRRPRSPRMSSPRRQRPRTPNRAPSPGPPSFYTPSSGTSRPRTGPPTFDEMYLRVHCGPPATAYLPNDSSLSQREQFRAPAMGKDDRLKYFVKHTESPGPPRTRISDAPLRRRAAEFGMDKGPERDPFKVPKERKFNTKYANPEDLDPDKTRAGIKKPVTFKDDRDKYLVRHTDSPGPVYIPKDSTSSKRVRRGAMPYREGTRNTLSWVFSPIR